MEQHNDWRLPTKDEMKNLYEQIGSNFQPTPIVKTEEYFIAFFDILGFEARLESLGLDKIIEKYQQLINIIDRNNFKQKELKSGKYHGSFWTSEGIPLISYEIKGAYASDSILIWANRKQEENFIPSDNFLNVCNELICSSIEIGLPLRGAISMGKLCIDEKKGVYLGKALVDIARLEKQQHIIGATPCKDFQHQPIQNKYFLPYKSHLKKLEYDNMELSFGAILDWPRHWRETRKSSVLDYMLSLNTNNTSEVKIKYDNTSKLVKFSELNSEYWKKEKKDMVHG